MVSKKNAATKLKNAAQSTAYFGERTRVETTVAMELAESWKPLMKSKASAMKTRMATVVSMRPPGGRAPPPHLKGRAFV